MNIRFDFGADPIARSLEVIGRLHADPELGAGAEVARKPERRIGRDRTEMINPVLARPAGRPLAIAPFSDRGLLERFPT